jgi:hypothetical protein
MFREKGMGNYRDLLATLAKNPTMVYWLDNCDNRRDNLSDRLKCLPSTPETRIASPHGPRAVGFRAVVDQHQHRRAA